MPETERLTKTDTRAYDPFQRMTSVTIFSGTAIVNNYSQNANDGKIVSRAGGAAGRWCRRHDLPINHYELEFAAATYRQFRTQWQFVRRNLRSVQPASLAKQQRRHVQQHQLPRRPQPDPRCLAN